MSDEESFVILGSTPTPSMELYDDINTSMVTKESSLPMSENGNGSMIVGNDVENDSTSKNIMQSSTQTIQNFSLLTQSTKPSSLSLLSQTENSKHESVDNSMQTSKNDFAEKFLMGEIPPDSLKYSIWKQFPSFCTSQTTDADISKLETLINERIKLKDNLQKTNEAMHQHLSTINRWQNRFKELQEQQAAEVAQSNQTNDLLKEELRLKKLENENLQTALTERDEFNHKLKTEIRRIMEEHEAKTEQFQINIGYAEGENRELAQELSAKNAVIRNMTSLISKLEQQNASFEYISSGQNRNDVSGTYFGKDISQIQKDFSTSQSHLNAAREQNINLMQDLTDKISTIKRLESQTSKLQHQLLSLEMIVNENGQKSYEDDEVVRKLNEELNKVSLEAVELRQMKADCISEVDQLKEQISAEKERSIANASKTDSLKSTIDSLNQQLDELYVKLEEQKAYSIALQKEIGILKSKDINADILVNQKIVEIKEENDFLKAQLDVYKSDFEMERQARQDIANEREELLSDLKLLQRRNQQLIDEAQKRPNGSSAPPPSSSPGLTGSSNTSQQGRPSIPKYVCPVCDKVNPNLLALQSHVQSCLDN